MMTRKTITNGLMVAVLAMGIVGGTATAATAWTNDFQVGSTAFGNLGDYDGYANTEWGVRAEDPLPDDSRWLISQSANADDNIAYFRTDITAMPTTEYAISYRIGARDSSAFMGTHTFSLYTSTLAAPGVVDGNNGVLIGTLTSVLPDATLGAILDVPLTSIGTTGTPVIGSNLFLVVETTATGGGFRQGLFDDLVVAAVGNSGMVLILK